MAEVVGTMGERVNQDHPSALLTFLLADIRGYTCGQGEYERAIALLNESLTLRRELADAAGIASALHNLGTVAFAQGEYDRATTLYRESLISTRELGIGHLAVESIEWLANVAAVRHESERAARLWGATDAWRTANRVPRWPVDREQHERMVAEARQQLDEATWTSAWAKGRTTSFEQAFAYALEESV
jgi:tetratricopeptide (TPR) repeat protein